MKRERASPPLYISLTGPFKYHYRSIESKPPAQGSYVPPSDMTPFPLRFRNHQPPHVPTQAQAQTLNPIGVLYFRHNTLPSSGFFVLWGLQVSQLEITEPSSTLGRSWWDEAEPTCAVVSWEDLIDGQLEKEHPVESPTSYLLRMYTRCRVYQTIAGRGWPSRTQELVTGDGYFIRAKITTVDFLDRRGLRLEVELSGR